MTFDLDNVAVIVVAPLGAPGTGLTNAQYTSLDSDRNALLARANITGMGAIPGVDLTGLADGKILMYQASSGHWIVASNLEALADVKVNNAVVLANAQKINFSSAFTGSVNGTDSTQIDVGPVFGTTSGTFRAGDQSANPRVPNRWTFAATGVLSSGSRTLATQTSSTLVNGIVYDWTAEGFVVCRNNVNNGTINLTITVNGSSLTYNYQCVGGVPSAMRAPHAGQGMTGTGAGITISLAIAYDSGDASDVRAGFVLFDAQPRR